MSDLQKPSIEIADVHDSRTKDPSLLSTHSVHHFNRSFSRTVIRYYFARPLSNNNIILMWLSLTSLLPAYGALFREHVIHQDTEALNGGSPRHKGSAKSKCRMLYVFFCPGQVWRLVEGDACISTYGS